jgi:SHS2 domain-containing protein
LRRRWEQVQHTADLALRIHGRRLGELFVNAARAMFFQIDPGGAQKSTATVEHQVRLQGMDRESLLVNWLNELLYLHETHREVYSGFVILALRCHQAHSGTAQFEAPCLLEAEAPAAAGSKSARILRPQGAQADTTLDAGYCGGPAQVPEHELIVEGGQEPCELSATIRGAPSTTVQQIIKAATFHGLEIRCGRQGCVATVVFDV